MLPVFYTVGCAILYCASPPYTTVGADAARFFFIRLAARTHHGATPYTTPRLNAACSGAMSVGVLGGPSLCYPLQYT